MTDSTDMVGRLLPCPFCGSDAELEHSSDHHGSWFNLGCSRHWDRDPDNRCIGGRLWYTETETSEADAISQWNSRPSALASESKLREIEAVVDAARTYYYRYAQDEADDLDICLNEQQHEDAKALRDALAGLLFAAQGEKK